MVLQLLRAIVVMVWLPTEALMLSPRAFMCSSSASRMPLVIVSLLP